jgi:hypothetical protein
MAKSSGKNVWIIPPHRKEHIAISGVNSEDKVTRSSEGKIAAVKSDKIDPALIKCPAVGDCTEVTIRCGTVTVAPCWMLIECGEVSWGCDGVKVTR